MVETRTRGHRCARGQTLSAVLCLYDGALRGGGACGAREVKVLVSRVASMSVGSLVPHESRLLHIFLNFRKPTPKSLISLVQVDGGEALQKWNRCTAVRGYGERHVGRWRRRRRLRKTAAKEARWTRPTIICAFRVGSRQEKNQLRSNFRINHRGCCSRVCLLFIGSILFFFVFFAVVQCRLA